MDTNLHRSRKIELIRKILTFDITMSYNDRRYYVYFKNYYLSFTDIGIWLNDDYFTNCDKKLFEEVKLKFNDVSNFESDVLAEERELKLNKIL